MRYRVRTPEGELVHESLGELQRAYAQGLVEPHDEVCAEGSAQWRRADSLPELRRGRGQERRPGTLPAAAGVGASVVLGALALFLLLQEGWRPRLAGVALALVVSSLLTRVTMRAFRRPGPRA